MSYVTLREEALRRILRGCSPWRLSPATAQQLKTAAIKTIIGIEPAKRGSKGSMSDKALLGETCAVLTSAPMIERRTRARGS